MFKQKYELSFIKKYQKVKYLRTKPHFGQKLQIQKVQELSCKEKLQPVTILKNIVP